MLQADVVFTIGHSNHSMESFVWLLKQHQINLLADVRSIPFSRWQPQFNRETLSHSLTINNIDYVFLGRELGARSEDSSCYRDGQVQYGLLAKTDLFLCGIRRVIQESVNNRVALMCAEKDPLECHRTLLVGKALDSKGIDVCHIHADGRLETNDAAMSRLLTLLKMPEATLFESRCDLVDQACRRQETVIAYKSEAMGANA